MDQRAYLALTAMLNAFPQTGGNPDLTMGTFEAVLASASSQSIIEAAQRFSSGLVEGQSMKFAPSSAEFAAEVRKRQEFIDIKSRPRLSAPMPTYRPGPLAPFEIAKQKALSANSHLPVLFEDINYDQFRKLSAAKEIPVGAKWVASLGIVYGPESKQVKSAA